MALAPSDAPAVAAQVPRRERGFMADQQRDTGQRPSPEALLKAARKEEGRQASA